MGDWNCLLDELPRQAESRILVTTQRNGKELINAKMKPTELGRLDAEQTSKLIRERLPGAGAGNVWLKAAHHFSSRIYGVTRGLPLAAIVLGGILRTKAYPSEWKEAFAEKLEKPSGEPRPMRCLWSPALEELPENLKSCFLYLATASENVLLDPARLVRLWIAEGFVAPRNGQTLEEVGLAYLKELIGRGLVELAEKDARGGIKTVAVHSLLHAFVQAEAQESSFVRIYHNADVLNAHAVRRLAIHNFVDSYVDLPDGFPKLRSLLCDILEEEQDGGTRQPRWPWPNPAEWLMRPCGGPAADDKRRKLHQLSIIKGSRFLRVVDLYGLRLQSVPDEIGSIIHLRYLGIRKCSRLSELPESISKLDNLQTLDLRQTKVERVTDELWELRGLRHVLSDELFLPARCPSRHLKQLQTLTAVKPALGSPDGWCGPLNHMPYLRSLAMCSIPDSTDVAHALLLALRKMVFLVSLSLSGARLPSGVFTNPGSRRLEDLALEGKLDSPPRGPFVLPNLSKLTLSGSGNLGQDFVRNVAELPNLAEMRLLGGSYGETELVLEKGGFPSLTNLTLNNLLQLEELKLNCGSVPELAVLTRCGCER